MTLHQLNSQRMINMAKLIKCSTGGIDNKVIKRQDLKPMPTSNALLEKLKQYKYFEYPMETLKAYLSMSPKRMSSIKTILERTLTTLMPY